MIQLKYIEKYLFFKKKPKLNNPSIVNIFYNKVYLIEISSHIFIPQWMCKYIDYL